ncbi:MAG: hypothetical protein KDA20_03170 [Phycisphaerales bacterium]|nr:hypothetical protein [Phycisphaerales bacterium]
MHLSVRFRAMGALAAAACCSATCAATLDFDDLGSSTLGIHMPDEYGGLGWSLSDWHYLTLAAAPTETFLALGGSVGYISGLGGREFFLDGADFWSRRAADAAGDFYFILYNNGVVVYDGRNDGNDGRMRFTDVHQLLVPNYTGPIDGFAFAFDGGGDDWDHLAMDNLQVRFVCPADMDGSGTVDLGDLNQVLFNFGETVTPGTAGDADGSGVVDLSDLNLVLFAFGEVC